MDLTFVKKEPDKAYIANQLWLPKRFIREDRTKKALEFTVSGKDGQEVHRLWEESAHHLVCPREYVPPHQYAKYPFPFVDLRPEFQRVKFTDLVRLRDEDQERAWPYLRDAPGGIFNVKCGMGKTKMACKRIAHEGTPTLIIVPHGGVMTQWKDSILGNPANDPPTPKGLEFEGGLGIIQGPVFDWAHPITLALVSTLWMRIADRAVPEELFRYFGLVIWDEAHRMAAPKFSLTAPGFYGKRLGLTATVKREDGLDPVYRCHIGEPFYVDLKQKLIPRIYFQQTPIRLDLYEAEDKNGKLSLPMLRSLIGRNYAANVYRYYSIQQALAEGRKVLCLSHSKDQLRLFHAMFPGSGLIISETDYEDRTEVLRNSQVCFAIASLGTDAVDDPRLDTLFWLTPLRSKIAVQQSFGRIQRVYPDKKTPVVVVFEDWMILSFKRLCATLKSVVRFLGYKVEPPSRPQPFPTRLPDEVEAAYHQAMSQLSNELEETLDDKDDE